MILVTSSSQASGAVTQSGSSLSAFGLTDQQFESKVKEYLGIPYRKGGTSRKGMDCSGFVKTVYNRLFDIELPKSAGAQFGSSGLKKIDTREMQPGDLIFFANNKKKRITHVGVYISDGQFIHASSSQGVTVSSLDNRYWKKRLVGSKRHKALNTNLTTDMIRVESTMEIPVHQKGMIRGYTRDDFRFDSLALQNEHNALDDAFFEINDLSTTSFSFYEIGYGHTLFDGFDVNLSALHERFDPWAALPGFDSSTRYTSSLPDASLPDTAERLGFKLSSDFRPSNWFSITPSITYFDYAKDTEDLLNTPEWSVGVNTLLSPINKQWALSMLLQYSEGEDLAAITSPYSRFSSVDMEIKLWINLADNLQFSIMGKHDRRTAAYGMQEDSLFMQSASSDLFLMLDFSY